MRTRQQRDAQALPTTAPASPSSSGGEASGDSDASSSSSGEESDTPSQQHQQPQHSEPDTEQLRAAWDDETLVCLLQLRYVEMDAHFRADCLSSAEVADAWHVLAHELNLRMDVAFSSLQCRARISALRKRWDEHSIARIRNGREQRTKHVEAIKLLTRLYRRRVLLPLKQVDKIAPRADCRGYKRFAEGVSDSEDDGEDREAWWVIRRQEGQEDKGGELEDEDATSLDGDADDGEQIHGGNASADTTAATTLWLDDDSPMTLERRHLELFRRQVVAEEAIAECTRAQVEATRQRVRAEREQLRLARNELELRLFTMAEFEPEGGDEERVAYEFVAMKRRQVAGRLARECEREERLKERQLETRLRSQRINRR